MKNRYPPPNSQIRAGDGVYIIDTLAHFPRHQMMMMKIFFMTGVSPLWPALPRSVRQCWCVYRNISGRDGAGANVP